MVHGAVRATAPLRTLSLPINARFVAPMSGTTRTACARQVAVQCGGVAVNPGDVIFGDDDVLIVASMAELGRILPVAEEIQARELAEHGITANAVAPGPVDTPMTRVLHSPEFRQSHTDAIAMNRYGTPEEIAAPVAYLASDGAAYLPGIVIPVDGGSLASGAR